MLGWRICRKRYVASALSGVGAEKHGGRWNHKGDRMVYMSSSLSLATLEMFVHVQPDSLPSELYSVAVTIPEAASTEEWKISDLPKNWRNYPAPRRLQELGSTWLRERRSLLLIVPSAVNPTEHNLMLNPMHTDAAMTTDVESQPFQFDPRLWKYSGRRR